MKRRHLLAIAGTTAGAGWLGYDQLVCDRVDESALQQSPVQATGDPVSVQRTIEGGRYYYEEDRQRVRHEKGLQQDGTREVEYTAWEQFGKFHCGSLARLSLLDSYGQRWAPLSIRVGDAHERISVKLVTRTDHDGCVKARPGVSPTEIQSDLPRTVTSTVSLEGHDYSVTYPVFVRDEVRVAGAT
ncbi:MAG: hypothetical protein ABEJ42_04810 [Halobacteriaceae archaeon]